MRVTPASEYFSSAAAWHSGAIHEVSNGAYVEIEQTSGEDCSVIAPHDSMSVGRFHLCSCHSSLQLAGRRVPPPTFQAAGRLRKGRSGLGFRVGSDPQVEITREMRSEEHTSELQSLRHLVCRLLLEKK